MKNWKTLIAFGILLLIIGFTIGYFWRAPGEEINSDMICSGAALAGLEFTGDEIDLMQSTVNENREAYKKIHEQTISNDIFPAVVLNPLPIGFQFPNIEKRFMASLPVHTDVPENLEELAYYSVRDLAYLIQNRKVTSVDLTKMFIDRLKKYDPELKCVITITEERALEEARKADAEIAAGKYRGLLHGIPYGVKDLLSAKGYKTTWGAGPYKDQVIDMDSTVVKKLSDAGAVLTVKLTLGALAWGDVWYGGTTKNPWDLKQGSSGSSAGPASAVSAGLLPFAIGSETWGSIVSPSTRCGVTGLRPTYGRVSRTGAMALSWSMDKLGPICRSVEDCAIVFNAIYGPDDIDQTLIDAPFGYKPAINIKKLRVGYLKTAFDEKENDWKVFDNEALKKLKEMGIELIPIELTDLPVESLSFILNAEAAAAFDELTRSGRDDLMKRQIDMAWPNVFRASRLIPAVEYIQANRLRFEIIQQMGELFKKIDLYISPSFGGNNLLLTNLTGHPCVVLPNGFDKDNHPVSITFIGNLFDEGKLMAFARVYQEATGFHLKRPEKYKP
ncbi:MAG: amidase [Acidobacteria bacterium]|nr:amidase [Acidobacteriota bacterium]